MFSKQVTIRLGNILTCAMIWLCLNNFMLLAQEHGIDKTETEFSRIRTEIQDLTNRRTKLDQHIQEQRTEIQTLKRDDDLNYFQRQRLEDLLKDAQSISNEIEQIDREIREFREKQNQVGIRLLELYDAEISARVRALEQEKLTPENKQAHLKRIESLREKQAQVRQALDPNGVGELQLNKLQIETDDSPRQIERKADLLKDQEEKLRKYANRLDEQAKDLRKELNLRTRINDLVTDIALFDQQEEAVTDASTQSVESLGPIGETSDVSQRRSGLEGLPLGQRDFDFTSLSTDQLETLLEKMAAQKARTEATADSLSRQADKFYRAAQETKKQ